MLTTDTSFFVLLYSKNNIQCLPTAVWIMPGFNMGFAQWCGGLHPNMVPLSFIESQLGYSERADADDFGSSQFDLKGSLSSLQRYKSRSTNFRCSPECWRTAWLVCKCN